MKADLIADLWSVTSEHLPEKVKTTVAQEFVTVLLDYGVSDSDIEGLLGIDVHLDGAVEYAIDDSETHASYDDDDDDEEEWD